MSYANGGGGDVPQVLEAKVVVLGHTGVGEYEAGGRGRGATTDASL